MSLTSTKVVCLSSPHFMFFVCMSSVSQKRAEMTRIMNGGGRTQERGLRTRAVKEGRGPQINQSSRLTSNQTHLVSLCRKHARGFPNHIHSLSLFLHKSYASPLMLKQLGQLTVHCLFHGKIRYLCVCVGQLVQTTSSAWAKLNSVFLSLSVCVCIFVRLHANKMLMKLSTKMIGPPCIFHRLSYKSNV